MAKISTETVNRWRDAAAAWLAGNVTIEGRAATLDDVRTGRDAWGVAHRSGICSEAYQDREIHDAHIRTALERIFPAAVFRDPKRY